MAEPTEETGMMMRLTIEDEQGHKVAIPMSQAMIENQWPALWDLYLAAVAGAHEWSAGQ